MSRLKTLVRERERRRRRFAAATRSARAAGSRWSCGRSSTRSRRRSSSSARPAVSRSRPRASRRPPGTCPGCTSRSRTRRRSRAASRARTARSRGAARCRRTGRSRSSCCGRRRHLRHRPAGALRRARARPPLPLRLLRQRGLHEHGRPALRRDTVRREHDDEPRRHASSSGKAQQRKDMTAIAVAHHVPYVAQAAASHWHDLSAKAERAAQRRPRVPQRPHRLPARLGPRAAARSASLNAAVDSCFWPLYEVVDGDYRLTYRPRPIIPGRGVAPPADAFPAPLPARERGRADGGSAARRRGVGRASREVRRDGPAALVGHPVRPSRCDRIRPRRDETCRRVYALRAGRKRPLKTAGASRRWRAPRPPTGSWTGRSSRRP